MKLFTTNKHIRFGWGGLLMAVVLGWAAIGCEEQDLDRTFAGPYFVRFTDTTLTFRESYNQIVPIRVHNVGPVLTEAIRINYTVSGTAREGRDYAIQGEKGIVVIPANKSFGQINIRLINNANNILESQSLTFTLTGVSPASLRVGLAPSGALGRSMRFTINDDCLFGGTYTGTSRVGNQNFTYQNIDISSTDCKQYILSNWNIGIPFFNFDAIKPTLRFVDNGDNTITVPAQTNAELGSTDTLRGNGAWNPRDRRITLNLQFKLRLTNNRDTTLSYTQTYTPQ
ncbi:MULTISPECIES: hypothetical protein [Spirosoma]|uniref:DUF4843 domain-containing protein n=1 Tax=Spirosoma sordidisoli TaxID=2502893 RepID=A0A4Q2UIK0_9BACT|nr:MULTISPECIES: hypothetical protein [Spirosoma]RYC69014.1 hypothetical protein EQG79_16575 [Spirosoma sordidisoli]